MVARFQPASTIRRSSGSRSSSGSASSVAGNGCTSAPGIASRAASTPRSATSISAGMSDGLEVDVDVPRPAEAAEQVPLGGEGAGVGEVGRDLLAHDAQQLVHPALILRAHADRAPAGPHERVVVLERRLTLTLHVGLQTLDHHLDHLAVDRLEVRSRREAEEDVHGVPLDGGQVVELREKHRGGEYGDAHQRRDQHDAPARRVGQRGDAVGDPPPEGGVGVGAGALAREPACGRGRQDRDRHEQRQAHRDRDRQRQVGEELALDVLEEDHRQEDRDGGRGRGEERPPDLGRFPRAAAVPSGRPASRRRTMFSSTTMAASRTMPTAKARPASEMTLSVLPARFSTTKVPSREIGMARATIRVARRLRRNHQRTPTASSTPSARLFVTSPMAR